MITNLWYGIEFASQLRDRPISITVLGQKLAAFRRPDGRPALVRDTCPRCGAPLSEGAVRAGGVVCARGHAAVHADGTIEGLPGKVLDAFPAEERYGLIFGFMGDLPEVDRAPIPVLPYFDDAGKYARVEGNFRWNAFYARVLENGVDAAHTPFVHGGSFGNPDEPEIEDYEVETDGATTARAVIHLMPQKSKGLWGRVYKRERTRVRTAVQWWLPNLSLLEVHLPFGELIIYNAHVPIDDRVTVSKYIGLRTFFKGRWADADANRRVLNIFRQDQAVVEAQRPELLPYDLGAELHVKSDAIQIAFRRARQRIIDRNWLLYPKGTRGSAFGAARLLPSPARRLGEVITVDEPAPPPAAGRMALAAHRR